jgi:hypothetical protein
MSEPALVQDKYEPLQVMVCGVCGIHFAAPREFWAERHKDHSQGWYCPNGHSRVFVDETEAQRLQRELDAAKRDADWQRQLREKADKKNRKLERRIANGVCPCCKRHFENVQRHIEQKHPDFPTLKKAE